MTKISTPIIDLLSLLDEYCSSHGQGSAKLKSCIWNIHKARRQKGGSHLGGNNIYSAMDVREELRARVHLMLTSHTNHVALDGLEGQQDLESSQLERESSFVVYMNGEMQKEGKDLRASVSIKNSDTDGLRNRKIRSSIDDKGKPDWSENNVENNEEEKLRNADPLQLFGGLTPSSLKHAQQNARESLLAYVETANLVSEILHLLSSISDVSSSSK